MWVLSFIFFGFIVFFSLFLFEDDAIGKSCFKEFWIRSFDFRGTTERKVFWMCQAWLTLTSLFVVILGFIFFQEFFVDRNYYPPRSEADINLFLITPLYIFSFFSFIPSLSIQIRRLRDAGKNPWWILISLFPFLGSIILLIFFLSPSNPNRKSKNKEEKLEKELKKIKNLLNKKIIDKEEYKLMRQQILTKFLK